MYQSNIIKCQGTRTTGSECLLLQKKEALCRCVLTARCGRAASVSAAAVLRALPRSVTSPSCCPCFRLFKGDARTVTMIGSEARSLTHLRSEGLHCTVHAGVRLYLNSADRTKLLPERAPSRVSPKSPPIAWRFLHGAKCPSFVKINLLFFCLTANLKAIPQNQWKSLLYEATLCVFTMKYIEIIHLHLEFKYESITLFPGM